MRRTILGIVAGIAVAIPMGLGVAAFAVDEPTQGVPASDCPDAVATMEEQGLAPADYFIPDCPDPAEMTLDSAMSPGATLDADKVCREEYAEDPAWCPTEAEVEAAEETGGQ